MSSEQLLRTALEQIRAEADNCTCEQAHSGSTTVRPRSGYNCGCIWRADEIAEKALASAPSLLPGDLVRTPEGDARVKRIEGGMVTCKHTVRGENTPGRHATRQYAVRVWPEADVVRVKE